jgi:hypothetical protein
LVVARLATDLKHPTQFGADRYVSNSTHHN